VNLVATEISGPLIVEPRVFRDNRGYFLESWNERRYAELGIDQPFVQDNVAFSTRGVLRGLHFQLSPHAQGKLVSVVHGVVFDVAVDIRPSSATFGQSVAVELSAESGRQFWVPPGFAHGYQVLSDTAVFNYKCTHYYAPHAEGSIRWNDPALGIEWPIADPTLSEKDAAAPLLCELGEEWLREPAAAAAEDGAAGEMG
jgi:dTDP-4-dehydrorhamnose 3,5-epimerase